ncbi:MAG: YegS/Rv2252/BmrU family lipid kinase [Bacteriovoracia bacterium]
MKRILLLVNPKARSAAGTFLEIADALKTRGHQIYNIPYSEKADDFNVLIRRHREEIDIVIVAGGDGSINYILPSLVETKLPLVVYPLGTANLLARSFDIKADLSQLTEIIEKGKTVPLDLGVVNGKYFINVCGLGISTEVNKRVTRRLKKITGPLSFWITGLKLRKTLKPFKMKLTVDETPPIVTRTWQITVCNGRKYGAWMTISSDATYRDGVLHCLSTEVNKRWEGIKLLPSYLRGQYKEKDDVTLAKGKTIRVETKNTLQIDVDGDIQTQTPAVFEIRPQLLNIIIPATSE